MTISKKIQKLVDFIYSKSVDFKCEPECVIYYATQGKWVGDPFLQQTIDGIKRDISDLGGFSKVEFIPKDSNGLKTAFKEVSNKIQKRIPMTRCVPFPKIAGVEQAFLGLVNLKDYLNFICDSDGKLQNSLFFDNVRSYLGDNPVNKEIQKALISEYVHTEKTVCLNSATAAMEMVLHVLGVGPGDEVIMPAYTYTASASVVAHVGATIVMVDSQKDNVEMDYEKLAEAITERTKVIVPVDLAGICADVEKIKEIITRPEILTKFHPANDIQKAMGRIFVSNDCAHSFGAERLGKMAGEIADFSSFSFHAVKNFTTAEGGAMTWNLPFDNEVVPQQQVYCGSPVPYVEGETWNAFIYRISQFFSLHGQNKDALAKTKIGAWEYDIIGPWYKCNMTDIMAALGLVQFERYPEMLEKRQKYVQMYNEGIDNLNTNLDANHQVAYLNHKDADHSSSHHLYLVRLVGRTREEANKVIEQMAERGIATNVHYKPLPMMTAYKALGFDIVNYPNAYNLFVNEITLPLNTRMKQEDVEYVIENFVEIVKSL